MVGVMRRGKGEIKVLVDGASWLGDALLSIPSLRRLRRIFPRGEIVVLTEDRLAGIYRLLPEIDMVIAEGGGPPGIKLCLNVARRLRDERFDLVLLFRNSFWSAAAVFFAGIPERIGYGANFRSPLLTKSLRRKRPFHSEHQNRFFAKLVSCLGQDGDFGDLSHQIELSQEHKDWARKWLMARGVSLGDLIIGLHPGASYGAAKRWPAEGFASLAKKLNYELGARVILLGGKGEEALASEVSALACIDLINASGQLDLVELASIMEMCDLMVCNDSGPMHLASAVGTPVVAIFGPTDPTFTGPLGTSVLIRAGVDCSPCFRRTCPADLRCMKLISPDMVQAGAKQLLTAAKSGSGRPWRN